MVHAPLLIGQLPAWRGRSAAVADEAVAGQVFDPFDGFVTLQIGRCGAQAHHLLAQAAGAQAVAVR